MSTIDFSCPQCGHTMKLPIALIGKKGKCPKCAIVNEITNPAGTQLTAPVTRQQPTPPPQPDPFQQQIPPQQPAVPQIPIGGMPQAPDGLVKPASPQVERIIERLLEESKVDGRGSLEGYEDDEAPIQTFFCRFRSFGLFHYERYDETTKAAEFEDFYYYLRDCKNILLYVNVGGLFDDEQTELLIDATEEELIAAYPESDAS